MTRTIRQDFERLHPFIVTGTDIAVACGVTIQAVSNWTKRWTDFPTPLLTTGHASIYAIDEVDDCLTRHGVKPDWDKV